LEDLSRPERVFHLLEGELVRNPEARIFLATDCAAFQQEMEKRFPAALLDRPPPSFSRGTDRDAREAATDMASLSRCGKLVLTVSSFGASAWWLGGCPPAVRLDRPGNHELSACGFSVNG
jgi:hypothetical protein